MYKHLVQSHCNTCEIEIIEFMNPLHYQADALVQLDVDLCRRVDGWCDLLESALAQLFVVLYSIGFLWLFGGELDWVNRRWI